MKSYKIFLFIIYLAVLSNLFFVTQISFASSKGYQYKGIVPISVKGTNGEILYSYSESHALLIGVSDYKYWNDLNTVNNELKAIENILMKHSFIITKELNPTGKELENSFDKFIKNYDIIIRNFSI